VFFNLPQPLSATAFASEMESVIEVSGSAAVNCFLEKERKAATVPPSCGGQSGSTTEHGGGENLRSIKGRRLCVTLMGF